MLHPVIALDGPAASGKSTVARQLAARLRFVYVDTGSMYRTFAWAALEKGIDPSSRPAVMELIRTAGFSARVENGGIVLQALGTDPTPHIREKRINDTVSVIAAIPELREYLVNEQRKLRLSHPLVMEGRDIGTVVFPDTPYKFFLDADPAIRDQRRRAQGEADSLAKRDELDRARASAPLIRAADAERIDSGALDAARIVELILDRARSLGLAC
jgi:cytidylate kinase